MMRQDELSVELVLAFVNLFLFAPSCNGDALLGIAAPQLLEDLLLLAVSEGFEKPIGSCQVVELLL